MSTEKFALATCLTALKLVQIRNYCSERITYYKFSKETPTVRRKPPENKSINGTELDYDFGVSLAWSAGW